VESRARTPTLPDDESTSELEPAGAEPRLQPRSPQPPSPHSAVSSREVDPQQNSGSRDLPRHRDHQNDNDRASVACSLTLPDDEGNNDRELADASPRVQSPASRDQADLQHTTAH
jgi:hypothetical protein